MVRVAGALVAVSLSALAVAGPLNPPAGPIVSTYKTLTEVEPRTPISAATTPGDADSTFKITQPGSYYLTGNMTGESGKQGIEVAADNVTIDLCGFTMTGVTGALAAIGGSASTIGTVVKGGGVTAWPGGGVVLLGGRDCLVTDLRITAIGAVGIQVLFNSIIHHCTVDNSTVAGASAGIQVQCCSLIESCHVQEFVAGANGIVVGNDCTIRACVVNNCGGAGVIANSGQNLIENCTVEATSNGGVTVGTGSVVRGCAIGSTGTGPCILVTGGDNRIERNNVRNSSRGLKATAAGNIFLGNTASGSTPDFDIVAGNVGLFVAAATGAAIFGESGGVSPGSTDASTNYSY